jgi:hypothetical protein
MTVQLRQKIVMISLAYVSIVQYALILGILMYAMNRFDIVNEVMLIFGIASIISIIISIIIMRTYQQDDVPFVKILLRLASAHIPAITGFVIALLLFV